jgi:hypothetical protein
MSGNFEGAQNGDHVPPGSYFASVCHISNLISRATAASAAILGSMSFAPCSPAAIATLRLTFARYARKNASPNTKIPLMRTPARYQITSHQPPATPDRTCYRLLSDEKTDEEHATSFTFRNRRSFILRNRNGASTRSRWTGRRSAPAASHLLGHFQCMGRWWRGSHEIFRSRR